MNSIPIAGQKLESVAVDTGSCKAPVSSILSFRQWITEALKSVGSTNSPSHVLSSGYYLSASLKVAILLTEKVSQVKDLSNDGEGSFDQDKQHAMTFGRDWAGCIKIELKTEGEEKTAELHDDDDDVELCNNIEPMSFIPGIDDNDHQDINALLESCTALQDMGIFDEKEYDELSLGSWVDGGSHLNGEGGDTFQDGKQDSCDALPRHQNCQTRDSLVRDMFYLNVQSVQFQLPDHPVNTNSESRRIYLLALVFIELFSGGERPPSTLLDLISADGAFVHLTKQRLSEKNEQGKSSSVESSTKRRISASSVDHNDDACRVACNQLKLLGVPNSLCRLIFNMLDCIYGCFKDEESYTSVKEIQDDLQLMMDKPKFLSNLDMRQQTLTGLQMTDGLIPRREELASILSCYHCKMSGSNEVAVITGDQGNGKTWLAEKFGQRVFAEGGIFLYGKFEMHQSKPFSAIVSAFDMFLDLLLANKESNWAKSITQKINAMLSQDASHLINLIPKLKNFVDDEICPYKESSHALQRLCYAIGQFVDIISSNAKVSICIDNLEFADAASILVLSKLLLKQQSVFFFIGCCRKNVEGGSHSFWDMIQQIQNPCIWCQCNDCQPRMHEQSRTQ
jgi:hypothetical protein